MKIKVQELELEQAFAQADKRHRNPRRPLGILRFLMRTLSEPELKAIGFSYEEIGMEKLKPEEPCLIIMNHPRFIDLKIAAHIFRKRKYQIVCTSDGFVGKDWLMRGLGCIPTNKFVTDLMLVKDMIYCVRKLKTSVLMYPEASYSFDGTATPLPASMGKCLKVLGVPVIMVRTYGAFARDPLYNGLQPRDVKVSATVEYLLSPEQIQEKTAKELNKILAEAFSFDNFKWQQDNRISVNESFRADYLNRVLYRCPACQTEGRMVGKGTHLTCGSCGKTYELTEYGRLQATEGETEIAHIPDWYRWERECVRRELQEGSYRLDIPVTIYVLVNTKCIYKVGEGRLTHTTEGFHLTGCDGKLDYKQKPSASYSLYSDYFWYELGDMICIGDLDTLYYCFPKEGGDVVAKTRLATEELYELTTKGRRDRA